MTVLQKLKGTVDNVDNLVNNRSFVTFRTHFRVDNSFTGKFYQLFVMLFTAQFLIRIVQDNKIASCQELFFVFAKNMFSENCAEYWHNLQSKTPVFHRSYIAAFQGAKVSGSIPFSPHRVTFFPFSVSVSSTRASKGMESPLPLTTCSVPSSPVLRNQSEP